MLDVMDVIYCNEQRGDSEGKESQEIKERRLEELLKGKETLQLRREKSFSD